MDVGPLYFLYSYCKASSYLLSLFLENIITTERIDPAVSKNKVAVSAHVRYSVVDSFIFL